MGAHPEGEELLALLEAGEVRAASPQGNGESANGAASWAIHGWVKEGILDLFRSSANVLQGVELPISYGPTSPFRDKSVMPVRRFGPDDDVRIVPGGSSVRRGAHLGPGVVCMPPMYVNVGAFVGAGSMIDSHALVGSCAQVGSGGPVPCLLNTSPSPRD